MNDTDTQFFGPKKVQSDTKMILKKVERRETRGGKRLHVFILVSWEKRFDLRSMACFG